MTSYLQKAGTKLFEKNLEQYRPEDPLYEFYTDKRGKQRRRKRAIPPGLSARDAKILKSVQRRAHYLDKGFSICGLRFGWTFIIGIIPGAGDVADVTLNYFLVVRKARQAELPTWLVRRMLLNNAISALSGLVPVAGDVVMAVFKANSRNAALLEEFLRIRGEEFLKVQADQAQGSQSVPGKDSKQLKPGAGMSDNAAATAPQQKTKFVSWSRPSRKEKERAPSTPGEMGRFVEDVELGATTSSGEAKGNPITVQKR
ncbi:hypothetical protein DFJ58DRAFT_764367 [Suillus subalutaceus]|uniref:uncharacterized protein n=1 Tax=Suillus subalutaceus TaxID=48586 RepID=UPI001B880178|nr:uncharacterized protein DFJ58DRAFT_764367 [Suillus subalutaceus]KAG1870738.1 hypothetical protein DFJ58DRAFT_764367 [Suillus subalutaceus]